MSLHWLNSLLVDGKFFQYELTRLLEISAIGFLAHPKAFGKGLVVGVINYSGKVLFLKITEVFFGIKAVDNPEVFENQKSLYDIVLIRGLNIITPLFEEIIYRGLIQKIAEWEANIILSSIKKDILFGKIKITSQAIHIAGYEITAKKIAIFVSTISFVLIHDKNPIALISMLPGSLYYGKLADEEGLIASTAAHMANNTISIVLPNWNLFFKN